LQDKIMASTSSLPKNTRYDAKKHNLPPKAPAVV
jgi:hypothetical protein